MLLIGLHGKRNVGKDTVAGMIKEHMLLPVQLIAFADRLKVLCSATFNMPIEQFYDQTLKESVQTRYGTPRMIMIEMADMLREKYGSHFFVDIVRDQIKSMADSAKTVVVTDIRTEYEAAMVRGMGGHIIHVLRETNMPVIDHESERGIVRKFEDLTLRNHGSLGDLNRGLLQALLRCKSINNI